MDDWAELLRNGKAEAGWDLFLDRYRRLIFATIRRYARDPDDVMDVFTRVLEALRQDEFRRLRSYIDEPTHRARFSTWLVAVVRNLVIDWIRQRDGRNRVPVSVQALPPLERRIFELVCHQRAGHVEAYELLRTRDAPALSFREFLAALRTVYRVAGAMLNPAGAPGPDPSLAEEVPPPDVEEVSRRTQILQAALEALPPDDRTLLQLYVVEGMAADAVARIAGLPNAKAVYNRVYRVLAWLRPRLEEAGVRAAAH